MNKKTAINFGLNDFSRVHLFWEDVEGHRHFKPTSYDVFQDSRIARVGRLLFYYYYYPM